MLTLSDADLAQLFVKDKPKVQTVKKVSIIHPDWNEVREELKQMQPSLYSYSQFNRYYKKFIKTLSPSMRQVHYSGDKLFIDYSDVTMPIIDQKTGEVSKAQIFVMVLGASGYTFVHATGTQSTKHFIESHVQAFSFYGGVPNILVP